MATQDEKLISALNLDLVTFNKLIDQGVSASKILKTNLRDLLSIRMGKELEDWNKIQERNNKGLKSGQDLLRDFYREQRIQDRTTREAAQSLIGFTIGLAALISTGTESDKVVKKFTGSVLAGVTAMQGAEFAAASLGIATRNFTGIIGRASMFLTRFAGPIGIIIGLTTAFVSFFRQTKDESAKAADEGLKKYAEMLDAIERKLENFTPETAAARRKALTAELTMTEARMKIYNELLAAKKRGDKEIVISEEAAAKAGISINELLQFRGKQLEEEYSKLQQRARELATEINSIPNFVAAKKPSITKEDEQARQKRVQDEIKKRIEENRKVEEALARAKEGVLEGDTEGLARLASTQQLNQLLANEEMKLAQLERGLLDTKNAAEAEFLNQERERSLQRIGLYNDELEQRRKLTEAHQKLLEQQVIAGFNAYDASKSLTENMAGLARQMIKQEIAKGVAAVIASALASSGPLGLFLAPALGMAASALFEQIVPKFGTGGVAERDMIARVGERGREYIAPEKSFYQIAREEIVPKIADIAMRQLAAGTVINNNTMNTNQPAINIDLAPLQEEMRTMRSEMSGIVKAIEAMPPSQVILENLIDFEQALRRKYPEVQRYYQEKYPDG
jgi:hypothetical protein